ncbi:MAG: riboflavin transporter FmnP [Alphaproteobacteria bacterium]|jgi:riboflavin transporter FmnP
MALFDAGHIVEPIDGVAGKFLKQAVIHHRFGPGETFFGRLENKINRAVYVTVFRMISRRAQKHCRVAIMTVGVHFTVVYRTVVK